MKAPKRYLEGAPDALLAVYDNGGETFDRYTALYGAPLWGPEMGLTVPFRGMSTHPQHPQGFGQWGEMRIHYRANCGRLVPFRDLPADVQRQIVDDCKVDS